MTNILDRLPVQDAVRTSILSRNWRFKWTLLTLLIFDKTFFEDLLRKDGGCPFNEKNLSRILLLKGDVKKFVLYVPAEISSFILDAEDINHWLMFLSSKGIKEFTLINMHETPFKLPTHLFSCSDLKHLELHNCWFLHVPSFCDFPNLLTLDFNMIIFESNFGEFLSRCPLLKILRIDHQRRNVIVKPIDIAKLVHIRVLSLSLCKLNSVAITSSGIFQVLGHLPNLEELALDFQKCKSLAEAGASRRVSTSLSLKTLTLCNLDFNHRLVFLFAIDLINGSPNLQNLKLTATHEEHVLPFTLSSWDVDCGITCNVQFQNVVLECIKDSEVELCLIKSLLAYSPSLRKMVINHI